MADRERDDMVKDMVKEVENLQNTLAGVLDDCKNEADSRRRLQVEVRTLKNLLNDEKRATVGFLANSIAVPSSPGAD